MNADHGKAFTAMAVSSVFFSLMSFCVKWADGIPPLQIVFFRALIAGVLCLVQLRWMGINPFGTHRRLLLQRGVFGSLALMAYFWSLSNLPLATASVLQSLSPLFTATLAWLFLGQSLPLRSVLWFALAGAGVVVIQGTGAGGSLGPIAIALCGAFFAACAYTTISRIGKREHPLVIVFSFPLVTVPLVTPMLPSLWVWPNPTQWAALLGVGICVQIAQVAMTQAYQLGPAGPVSLVKYLGLVWAGLGGWLLFQEPLTLRLIGGAALIVLAVVGISRSKAGRAR